MKNYVWSVVLVALVLLATPLSCYKILFMLPFASKSHAFALHPVGLELAKRGHEITFASGVDSIKNSTNVHGIMIPAVKNVMDNSGISFFEAKATDFSFLDKLITVAKNLTKATYTYPLFADILKNPRDSSNNPKFDLLVVDAVFNEFTLPLAQKMGIPSVYMSPGGLFPSLAWSLNIPHPYSYIPSMVAHTDGDMTMLDRLKSTAFNMMFICMRDYSILPAIDSVVREYYPEARPIRELEREVAFVMTNSHPSFHSQIPTMPYFVEVGGLNLVPSKKLPKELEDFMQSSGEHGVIYFSLGSYTQGESMPLEMRTKVIEAFRQMPQKVLWKYEQDITDENFPKNIKLTKWAPQQDLLGHPKMRVFITHGGGMSCQEAAYHGCPIVGFPLSADQDGNIVNAVKKGFGEFLDWRIFTTDELVTKLKTVINDKKYKQRATELSELLRDRPQPPVETAAYWLEYVIRHKGAPHLKSGADKLNFFQYFLLDVIGAVLLVLYLVLNIGCFILRKLLGLCGINVNLCPFSLCRKLCPGGWCSKTCPAAKSKSVPKGHKKKE